MPFRKFPKFPKIQKWQIWGALIKGYLYCVHSSALNARVHLSQEPLTERLRLHLHRHDDSVPRRTICAGASAPPRRSPGARYGILAKNDQNIQNITKLQKVQKDIKYKYYKST